MPDSLQTPRTAAHKAPQSIGFSRQGYRGSLLFPSVGHLPDPGIEPGSPALQADSLPTELPGITCGTSNMPQMNLSTKQTHRHVCGCQRGRRVEGVWTGSLGLVDTNYYT